MMRLTLLALLLAQADPAAVPDPMPPAASAATFRLPPGLKAELVAAEPEVQSPVAAAFDEDGGLWVVEMLDYPNPVAGKGPQGRVKRLVDQDGDGRYETASVVAEGLLMANGVLPWKGGAIVTRAPNVLFVKAGRPPEELYAGFAVQNPQLRVSHPTFGLDNWIYAANGQRGGKIRPAQRPDAAPIDIGGRDFRFDLVRDRAEAVSGFGQFGLTFDDWGRRFVCTNRNHLVPMVIPDRYYKRNPFLAPPPPAGDNQGSGGAARIFPISRNKTLASHHAGSFTASCGVTVYRGSRLPAEYRGRVLTCEPTGNLVHEEVLAPAGGSFTWSPPRPGQEFLASTDPWFRPVSLAHGPDGALYVVDMYRPEVEHPEWVPADLKHRYNFDHRRDLGRIWRIVPEGPAPALPRPRLSPAAAAELVPLLDHPDAWWRSTAQRLLVQRQDGAAWGPLRELARNAGPHGRLHAAWTLEGLGRLDLDLVLRLLVDPHPRVRENAARLAEPWAAQWPVTERLAALADDPDGAVRWQAALSLGEWDSDAILDPLARIAKAGSSDRWTRLAIATAVPTRAGRLIPKVDDLVLVRELSVLVGGRREAAETAALLKSVAAADLRRRAAVVNGLAEGAARRGASLSTLIDGLPDAAAAREMLASAAGAALDAARPVPERVDALKLLAHVPWETAAPVLAKALEAGQPGEIRLAAVATAGAHRHEGAAPLLVAPWKSYLPAERREVLEAFARRTDRLSWLLGEIEGGRFLGADLGPALVKQLVSHADAALRERARKGLADVLPPDRSKVIEAYKPALALKGDAARGRETFAKNCVSCHRIGALGTAVGPDISDTLSKSREQLLNDILDPSRVIDNNYANFLVRTKSGAVFSGFIAAQTETSLTLRRGEGQQDVVLRTDIEDLRSSGLSLMPEGLEKAVTVEAMADLLQFLKTWRDLEGR